MSEATGAGVAGSLRWGLQRGGRTPDTDMRELPQGMQAQALSLRADASPAISVDGAVFPFVLE